MKSYVVLLLIATSVTTAALLHTQKISNTPDEMDGPIAQLELLKRNIKPGSRLAYRSEGARSEMFLWARYALAPVIVRLYDPKLPSDTLLLVTNISQPDTLAPNEKVIATSTDDNYAYRISTFH